MSSPCVPAACAGVLLALACGGSDEPAPLPDSDRSLVSLSNEENARLCVEYADVTIPTGCRLGAVAYAAARATSDAEFTELCGERRDACLDMASMVDPEGPCSNPPERDPSCTATVATLVQCLEDTAAVPLDCSTDLAIAADYTVGTADTPSCNEIDECTLSN